MPLEVAPSALPLGPGDAVVFSDRALYQTYNFHDPEGLGRLAEWLARDERGDASGVSVVVGRPGAGRDYSVCAAAWLAGERGVRVRHARLSFDGFDPDRPSSLADFVDHQLRMRFAPGGDLPPSLFDRRGALLGLAGSLPATFLSAAGLSFLAAAALSLVDVQSLLRSGVPVLAGPRATPESYLRAILDFATRSERLVLALPADELPEPVVQWFVHEPRRNRRLSVMLSMASAPAADALYGEPLAQVVELRPMTPEVLRERVNLRFTPNKFPDRFFSGVWRRTRGVPGQVALAMMDLDRLELIARSESGAWRLTVESDNERLVEYFASHFYDQLNQIRNQHGPLDLHLVRFVELAALCGYIAPPRLIASYMGLASTDCNDLLHRVNALEDAGRPVFVSLDYQHPTFRNEAGTPELVYRFADESNRLIVLRRMVHRGKEAKGFLRYLAGAVPVIARGSAELFATLASYLPRDSDERQEYDRELRWWIAAEEAGALAAMVAEQIAAGEVDVVQVVEVVDSRVDWIPLRRLALLDAVQMSGSELPMHLLTDYYSLRARMLLDIGEYEEALFETGCALELLAEPTAYKRRIHLYARFCCQFLHGHEEEGLFHAREASRITDHVNPTDPRSRGEDACHLAKALLGLSRHDEAQVYIDEAIFLAESDDKNGELSVQGFINELGILLDETKRHQEASRFHRKVLTVQQRIDAEHGAPSPNQLMALYVLGESLRDCGELHESRGYLTQAADLALLISTQNHPAYAGSLINLLCIEMQLGSEDAMLEWTRRLEAVLANGNPDAVRRLAGQAQREWSGAEPQNSTQLPDAVRRLITSLLRMEIADSSLPDGRDVSA